jgi:uncharacterized protein with PIN domain
LTATIIPLDEAMAQQAVTAYERYGKGRQKATSILAIGWFMQLLSV